MNLVSPGRATIDLNLIRVFVTVYDCGTVTAAAHQLHMTQPSVTQALQRLQREAGTPLFVRKGRGIAPTRAADQLYREVAALPSSAEAALHRLTTFDPATTRETFRLALTDLGQLLFLPTLYPVINAAAPHCTVEIVTLNTHTVAAQLAAGRIDIAVASSLLDGDLHTSVLRHDSYWCVARKGRFGSRTPSFDELATLPRIVARDTLGHRLLEAQLPPAPAGSIYLPAFAAMPSIVAASDVLCFVPNGIVHEWAERWNLDAWQLPAKHFTSTVHAHTARIAHSSASAWFAACVIDTIRGIEPAIPQR